MPQISTMASAIFDTHAFVKRLTAAGMPEAQAEILAEEQARLIDERLATKADLARAIPDETDPPRTPTRFAHREKIALDHRVRAASSGRRSSRGDRV
jgi:hypothetical protein